MSIYAKAKAKGLCPACWSDKPERKPVEGRTRCAPCLESNAKACRNWRVKNKAKHNAYMRAYMQRRRATNAPREPLVEGASPSPMGTRDALLARLEVLRGQI